MIDFKNKKYLKLKQVDNDKCDKKFSELMVEGEEVVATFKSVRDMLVFTNKRIVSINTQGLTGKKIDYSSLPYSKIICFSIETAGTFDIDNELVLWFSGLGQITFELKGKSSIIEISKVIGRYALK